MKVHVDASRCEAHGICEQVAPEVFRLDDDDQLHYDATPEEVLRDKVHRAIASCPVQAIRLME